ncbi:uncharacterized protein LOC128233840 isoform X2 [Mya arenaria]|uniref:uncharacterized protein LOC128233840 isoform X2 n=1 Tax=Mya arenaria TaxID=6604 RepID=UPI0022E54E39|nr:uncharacterized protein LOC128233840 isoform X2 [Mya arenaria]
MDARIYVPLCCTVLVVFVGDASGSCGSLAIIKPTFVNRTVTLKFIPRHRGISNIAWKYTNERDVTREHTVKCVEEHFQQHVEDGPYYHTMIFIANKHHNNSKFHVQCSDAKGNSSSNTVKLHLNEIRSACGNLVLLSPEIKYGTNVEIAYYPSDLTLAKENPSYNERSWLKLKGFLREAVHLRNDTYEERKISDYLYTLTIYNFIENKAGPYALKCGYTLEDTTNRLDIHVTDKPLIGPILDDCVYGNADTIIYCNTSRTTGKPRVTFSIGSKVVTMLENEKHRGVYTVVLDSDTWRDNDDHIVTCKVSNDDYVHDLNSSAKLCYMEKGSDPFLIMPEYIYDENTTVGCEVSNVRPPEVIEILVDNQAIDAIQKDLLNETSKTFVSKASISMIDKHWNGKEICCRRKSTIYGNVEATCKTFNIKYSPTELIMKATSASSNSTRQSINVSCFTTESNPPCGVNLSTNTTQLVNESSKVWKENTTIGFKSYINATFSAAMMVGIGIINCFTTCDENLSNLDTNLTIDLPIRNGTTYFDCTTGETRGICNEKKCPRNTTEATDDWIIKCERTNASENGTKPRHESVAGDISTRSFKLPLQPILIGTGAFVALGLFVALARTLVGWRKGKGGIRTLDNKDVTPSAIEAAHSLDTNEYVEMPETSMHMNASHDLEDDYVELKTREDSTMARKPITAIESKHAKSGLIYADLDIDHLQKAFVGPIPGPRPNRRKEATVYQDIDFSNTKPARPH